MADTEISDLPDSTTLDGTEVVPIDQGGVTVKTTTQDIADLATGSGTVTSVDMSVPADFAIAGNPITSSGTLALTETTQSANTVKAGPASGSAAGPTYRALVAADLPATAVTAGSYGDATHVGAFTVDAQGRLTSASSVAITGGGGGMTNPMTTADDMIVGGSSGTPARLGIGAEFTVLQVTSGAPAWGPTGNNTVLGNGAFASGSASYNVAIGPSANAHSAGDGNIGIGVSALTGASLSGADNVGIGRSALTAVSSGSGNVGIVNGAGQAITSGSNDICIGFDAFHHGTSGSGWVAIGNGAALAATTANYGVAIGLNAQTANVNGDENVSIGHNAHFALTGSGGGNTTVGGSSSAGITTGANNSSLGYNAGSTVTIGSNNLSLGQGANPASATADNQFSIQNLMFGFGNSGTGTTLSTGRIAIGKKTDDGVNRLQVDTVAISSSLSLPGTTSQYVRGDGSLATFSALTNPMTTADDLIIGGSGGTPARLPIIANGTVLGAVGGVWTGVTPAGIGTVTSVGMSVPAWLSVSGSPITSAGTLAVTATTGQTANFFLAAPNGSSGALSPRAIVAADIPTLNQSTSGNAATATALATARAINGVNFDGSAAITVPSKQLVGINDQTGTSYTLVLSDAGKDVRCNNASAVTLTVPANASVAFPIGTIIIISQKGAGAVTATSDGTSVIHGAWGVATTAQYDFRSLEKTDTDTWRVG